VNDNIVTLMLYHYWDSTCSMKVRFCIEEKGISHQKTFVDPSALIRTLSFQPLSTMETRLSNPR
jgi:glutathione S-transferase